MCKAMPTAEKQTAIVVNQLESSSVEFHGPTMVQSIMVTLGIRLVLFLLVICCKHYGCCSIAELANRRYELGRWATGQQPPAQPAVVYHQPAPPMPRYKLSKCQWYSTRLNTTSHHLPTSKRLTGSFPLVTSRHGATLCLSTAQCTRAVMP